MVVMNNAIWAHQAVSGSCRRGTKQTAADHKKSAPADCKAISRYRKGYGKGNLKEKREDAYLSVVERLCKVSKKPEPSTL